MAMGWKEDRRKSYMEGLEAKFGPYHDPKNTGQDYTEEIMNAAADAGRFMRDLEGVGALGTDANDVLEELEHCLGVMLKAQTT